MLVPQTTVSFSDQFLFILHCLGMECMRSTTPKSQAVAMGRKVYVKLEGDLLRFSGLPVVEPSPSRLYSYVAQFMGNLTLLVKCIASKNILRNGRSSCHHPVHHCCHWGKQDHWLSYSEVLFKALSPIGQHFIYTQLYTLLCRLTLTIALALYHRGAVQQ